MGVNEQLTDRQRVQLTKKAYAKLELGQRITVGPYFIGMVARSVYAADGLRAFVITNPTEVTLLFKGSSGFLKGNPTTWHDEWLKTNLPLLLAMLLNEHRIPSQLQTAAKLLNETLSQFKDARFYLYGHSLGSINAQYALANCRHPQRIAGAYLYEGTNIWPLLTAAQRRRVSQLQTKIFNYVDIYDPVTLGLTSSHHMVGKLCYIDSQPLKNPIKQHLWGGYHFDKNGKLKLRTVDQAFLEESKNERQILLRSKDMASLLEKMGHSREVKKMVQQKILALTRKHPDHKSLEKLNEFLNTNNLLNNKDDD